MAKLDYKQMTFAYVGGSIATVTTGAVSAGIWSMIGGHPHYGLAIAGTWMLFIGGPSVFVASNTLLEVLGQKRPKQISVSPGSSGRKVPIHYGGGKTSHVFLNEFNPFNRKREVIEVEPPELPMSFEVGLQVVTLDALDTFLYRAWRRQLSNKPGLSRSYWLNNQRWKRAEYEATIFLLNSANLIGGRAGNQSGKLIAPPKLALEAIKAI